jgi:predicted acylesterase/phospholipase RssA
MAPADASPAAQAREALRLHADGRADWDAPRLAQLAERQSGPGGRRLERRLLRLALERSPGDIGLVLRLVLATYKDVDLPERQRYDRSLRLLREQAGLDETDDPRVHESAGAIHKRLWQHDGQIAQLERSLDHYALAHEMGTAAPDYDGYAGINAALNLDLLAGVIRRGGRSETVREVAGEHSRRAREIRASIAARLHARLEPRAHELAGAGDYWLGATLAEARFGSGDEAGGREWAERSARVKGAELWMRESTATQLVTLAGLLGLETGAGSEVLEALRALVGPAAEAMVSGPGGKVGLALSGGGFRASLFHVGVLARLAELDVLRHVEVLSCVSGGSILGTSYYLRLRRLLQTERDRPIVRDDYIALVSDLADEFLAGVGQNVRMRLLTDLWSSVRMLVSPRYDRTTRAGELYERYFYRDVLAGTPALPMDPPARPADPDRPRMRDLRIRPADEPPGFAPKRDNWRRTHKVPILILNAATLNTGHNWQFTATWMGEPPSSQEDDVDRNPRLRRVYYDDAPDGHGDIRLGTAVASSAALPAVFPPVKLAGLYEDVRVVRLVDGGAHDNQGVAGLSDQDCTIMLISDASGQMPELTGPPPGPLQVASRTTSMLGSRVRKTQWEQLQDRLNAGALRGVMFLHLRRDLEGGARDWEDCQDPQEDPAPAPAATTSYGMLTAVQGALARLRTDLDAFSDVEAQALMLSGYRMTDTQFAECLDGFPHATGTVPWSFTTEIGSQLESAAGVRRAQRILEVGSGRWLKAWRLVLGERLFRGALAGAVVLVLAAVALVWRDGLGAIPAVALWAVLAVVALAVVGVLATWVGASLHVWVVDRAFRRAGAIEP